MIAPPGYRFAVGFEAIKVKGDGFFDITLGLFQRFTLCMAARQSRHQRYVAAFRGLFVKDRIE